MERPSVKFCNRIYSLLDGYCNVEFLAYYTLESKSSKTYEYQLDKLDSNLIEYNYKESSYYPTLPQNK